ncbi:MAG TPA: hypothetical protein VEU52_05440, partial [Candidatus Limnocylindrales bacterium]|nr:hypothetical protein [Candidatus Limnocylindrales bacterium]
HGPKPQTAGPVSENEISATGSGCDLRKGEKRREQESQQHPRRKSLQAQSHIKTMFFNSHRRYHK